MGEPRRLTTLWVFTACYRSSFTLPFNCLVKDQVQQPFLQLQHTKHHLSLDGFSNCVAVLALDFDTPVSWYNRFSDFLRVCSSLAPMLSNFSSVSTRHLCFCFLCIKSPFVLSLFTELWTVCLLRILSTRNLRRNFHRHFLADPYFTWVAYRNTRCSKVHRTMTYHTAHYSSWEKIANGVDNSCLLLTNHKFLHCSPVT
jgi:hypothetical protein